MNNKLIIIIVILSIIILGFIVYNIFQKPIIFASNDLCNSECLIQGYDQGVCNNGLKLTQEQEYKNIGKCAIQECNPYADSCGCTCLR